MIFLILFLLPCASCWASARGCEAWVWGRNGLNDCYIPWLGTTSISPWYQCETIRSFQSVLKRSCGSLMAGNPAFDSERHIIIIMIVINVSAAVAWRHTSSWCWNCHQAGRKGDYPTAEFNQSIHSLVRHGNNNNNKKTDGNVRHMSAHWMAESCKQFS